MHLKVLHTESANTWVKYFFVMECFKIQVRYIRMPYQYMGINVNILLKNDQIYAYSHGLAYFSEICHTHKKNYEHSQSL